MFLPNRRMRLRCCALAANGQATADPAIPLMKSRRRIAFPKALLRRRWFATRRLQQGFTTGGMGFSAQFAQRQIEAAHVRFGSLAGIARCQVDVRFTPKSGHQFWFSAWPN